MLTWDPFTSVAWLIRTFSNFITCPYLNNIFSVRKDDMVAEAERKQRLVETILSVMYLLIPGMFRQQDWHAWSKYPASGIYSHSDPEVVRDHCVLKRGISIWCKANVNESNLQHWSSRQFFAPMCLVLKRDDCHVSIVSDFQCRGQPCRCYVYVEGTRRHALACSDSDVGPLSLSRKREKFARRPVLHFMGCCHLYFGIVMI